ncbi:putative ribonuclease H-like domain-containing protein [Tanacetum coccineum]
MIKNKARLVAQGYIQEEGIDYDEVFAPIVRIESIRLFLAYASFKDFVVYQMDIKSAFLYGKIEKEVNICQPPGFEDPNFPDRVYKVEKALYGLYQAPKAWYETLSTSILENYDFKSGKLTQEFVYQERTKGLHVKQKEDGIFISQDKYVTKILKNSGFTDVKIASTSMETQKPFLKDEDGEEVDVYLYRSMIGSLMYLTSSRPDIMFVVCACGKIPNYARASLDRKSTTGGCQFLGCRLISWQCKKQTVVANSTKEAEFVAASSCYDLLTKAFDDAVKVNGRMCTINGQWKDTIKYLEDFHAKNKIWSVLKRIVIAASIYHIWIKRNKRIFQNVERSSDTIAEIITEDVRFKLTSLRVIKSDAVKEEPLVLASNTEDGVTRLKEYVELTPTEAIQADCDIKAINIILQGLPTEIYALVSQHRVAKDLWEKIKLLMQGTSLTKQERRMQAVR